MDAPIWETITPKKAEAYLNRNTGNRKLRDGVVDEYAHDMRNGTWTICPEPITIYDNGDIADGQHRLWAIIEADAPQKFLVLREFPRPAGLNVNTGRGRTVVDNARISGVNLDLTNEIVSIAKVVEQGKRSGDVLPNSRKVELAERHMEAVQWTVKHGPRGRYLRNQCVMAAVARAWYHEEDKEKLARFCKVLSDGFADGASESAAIALRNYLIVKRDAHLISLFSESFYKIQNCIRVFMRGKSINIVRSVATEPYPLQMPQLPAFKQNRKNATYVANRRNKRLAGRAAQASQ